MKQKTTLEAIRTLEASLAALSAALDQEVARQTQNHGLLESQLAVVRAHIEGLIQTGQEVERRLSALEQQSAETNHCE